MPFAKLAILHQRAPLQIQLIDCSDAPGLSLIGLAEPLRLAEKLLGPTRLELRVGPPASATLAADLTLLVADGVGLAPDLHGAVALCRQSVFWGAVGAAVLWLARAGQFDGVRVALPWALYAQADDERAILTPQLFELDGNVLTCCGGSASVDLAMTLIAALFGPELDATIRAALCIDRVRAPQERQRLALQERIGAVQPKLAEALALMEANLEEPLAADDLASLVGLSRRQLDRLFKQHLASVPSRYYLELRLQRARQLLLESHHSIVQVGLMCGFSSGSHFSTAYGALFGITPRQQRQRQPGAL
ncbi:transcriptional regulator GlxA family with amidase domain [Actimicrobium sp. GrIS 1.19]|uniref:GlxA family transcriptional regulator n=1 Tax=Actimicrobium sp. GrIS 1.19 TaxID=3071708 RepID=UPI002DFEAE18|nr:transcriptional regulator GlxA family with amidase domain [Actimicrobium sp. GrIS 1.19]